MHQKEDDIVLNYQKLYATLLGRVDEALTYMERDFADPRRMEEAARRLRLAIQEAEETYLRETAEG